MTTKTRYIYFTQTSLISLQTKSRDPITSIAASDTIEFLCAANSGVYTDLASSYLHVKTKITAADGANLDADVQVGPVR